MNKKFWKEIKKIIPQKKSKRRPRKGAKKIMRAVFYILKTGIPWKALPKSFLVSASTVHRRFQEWIQDLVFFEFWKSILVKYQKKNFDMQRWVALDVSMSKAPLGGEKTGPSPVDRKKIGTKKHICVDQNGIVVGIAVAAANQHDDTLVQETIESIPIELPKGLIVCAADAAYDSQKTTKFLKQRNFVPLISKNKRRSSKKFPKTTSRHRWIVERTHGNLNSWRGIFTRWNKKVKNYVAAIQIAATFYTLRYL
jgi:transposase